MPLVEYIVFRFFGFARQARGLMLRARFLSRLAQKAMTRGIAPQSATRAFLSESLGRAISLSASIRRACQPPSYLLLASVITGWHIFQKSSKLSTLFRRNISI